MKPWPKVSVVVGSLGVLLGSLDPMEGSLLILPGSGLVALGVYFGHADRKIIKEWLAIFILNGIGVGALWGLSAVGGIGGKGGHSMWWGVLILPYLFGWLLGVIRIFGMMIGYFKARGRSHHQGSSGTAAQ